jgi:hypothetical protein
MGVGSVVMKRRCLWGRLLAVDVGLLLVARVVVLLIGPWVGFHVPTSLEKPAQEHKDNDHQHADSQSRTRKSDSVERTNPGFPSNQ